MKRKVIEAFDYAADGVRANRLKVGRRYEFPDDLANRFEAEGKLEPLARPGPRGRTRRRSAGKLKPA